MAAKNNNARATGGGLSRPSGWWEMKGREDVLSLLGWASQAAMEVGRGRCFSLCPGLESRVAVRTVGSRRPDPLAAVKEFPGEHRGASPLDTRLGAYRAQTVVGLMSVGGAGGSQACRPLPSI